MFILDTIRALETAKVEYAICGGYAVALHGVVRGTIDLDLVLRMSRKNFENAERALLTLGFVSRVPVKAAEVVEFRNEYIKKRNLIAWSFVVPDDPSRVVDIILTTDLQSVDTVIKTVGKFRLRVIAIPDLIKMKLASGREQDLEDVKALRELEK